MAIKDEISAAVRAMVKQAVNFGPGGMAMVTNGDGIPIPYTDNTLIRNGGKGGTPITVGGAKREYDWQKYREHATKTLGYDPVSRMRREALLGPVRMVEEGVLGATGAVGGAMAGVADAGNNYGWGSFVGAGRRPGAFSDAWSHVGNVAAGAAKEMTRPETVNHFNGMLGSAAANTAYDFLPGIVGIVSDKGAQKVRDAQDAIGLGAVRDYADGVRDRSEEALFRKRYGDKGWEDYARDPNAFKKSHPEIAWSHGLEGVGRTSLGLAAGFKGFGAMGKVVNQGNKVKALSVPFKHPVTTGAVVGGATGLKKGIETGSVSEGLTTGLNNAAMTTAFLGGSPGVIGAEMAGGVVSDPSVRQAAINSWRGMTGQELEYINPEVKQRTEAAVDQLGQYIDMIDKDGYQDGYRYLMQPDNFRLLSPQQQDRLRGIGERMHW